MYMIFALYTLFMTINVAWSLSRPWSTLHPKMSPKMTLHPPTNYLLSIKRPRWNITTGEDTRPTLYIPLEPEMERLHRIRIVSNQIAQLERIQFNLGTLVHPIVLAQYPIQHLVRDLYVGNGKICAASIRAEDIMREFMADDFTAD